MHCKQQSNRGEMQSGQCISREIALELHWMKQERNCSRIKEELKEN